VIPEPPHDAAYEWLAEDYAESEEFDIEACRHVADVDIDTIPVALMEWLRDFYRESKAFQTRVEDALNEGIKTW
jgi:hypothetical protein